MKRLLAAAAVVAAISAAAQQYPTVATQARHDADMLAASAQTLNSNGLPFRYESGVLLDGMAALADAEPNPVWRTVVCNSVDAWIDQHGDLKPEKPFDPSLHSLDNIEPARAILYCFHELRLNRFSKAATFLYAQLAEQPRTPEGGYCHKQMYPNQMWLDGAYMAEPFRAAFAAQFFLADDFDDIAKQFELMAAKTYDPKTGLLRHGWDATRQQPWADKTTGQSQEAWARANGWYLAALADALPYFPATHPARARLLALFARQCAAVAKYQDASTGVWWDVLDKGTRAGNLREASASAMFVYAFAKGVRLGYLPASFHAAALKGWQGIERNFVEHRPDGSITMHGTVKVSGLGGEPYRAGDFDYYVHEPVADDDPKGVGAFLLAASEMIR